MISIKCVCGRDGRYTNLRDAEPVYTCGKRGCNFAELEKPEITVEQVKQAQDHYHEKLNNFLLSKGWQVEDSIWSKNEHSLLDHEEAFYYESTS